MTLPMSLPWPREVVIATGNRSKGAEMAQLLEDLRLPILTLDDFPGAQVQVEETGATYAENAEIKARAAAAATGRVCIADDAGLEIDWLGGQPGLHSRRFLGEHVPFSEKMDWILHRMREVPDDQRSCRFRCAVVIAVPDGRVIRCEGICEGRVAREKRGAYGFGYDPLFLLPALGLHMAELPPARKHQVSHRGKAMECARRELRRLFGLED